jgi:predicted nucleic acid-binding protein
MKTVFVDTSGSYACLDRTDPFHPAALAAFERAEKEGWTLVTTNYVTHETWALVQRRLGWDAVGAFLNDLLPRCEVQWVDETLHRLCPYVFHMAADSLFPENQHHAYLVFRKNLK